MASAAAPPKASVVASRRQPRDRGNSNEATASTGQMVRVEPAWVRARARVW
jgi:hypothetical protein